MIVTYSVVYRQMSIELNPVHGQCFSISKTATAMANTLVDNVQANMLQAWYFYWSDWVRNYSQLGVWYIFFVAKDKGLEKRTVPVKLELLVTKCNQV